MPIREDGVQDESALDESKQPAEPRPAPAEQQTGDDQGEQLVD